VIRVLAVALALLAPIAARAVASAPADEARHIALMRALRAIGVEVGAVWPIGDVVYVIEAIDIVEQPRTGEYVITVKTKLLPR
jgi:hypothetical protein